MKLTYSLILAFGLAGGALPAAEPSAAPGAPSSAEDDAAPSTLPIASPAGEAPPDAPDQAAAPAADQAPAASDNGTNCLRLNFRDASLDSVLDYLSEAAGYVIVKQGSLRGKINVVSYQPVSKEEALDLLTSELNRNGYTAIRKGRVLRIVNKDEAKTQSIPVRFGGEPDEIPENDEMVTQIIPIRFVEATQLLKDIQPLISSETVVTANESGNSIVITDTQANIRRVAEVIKAIDSSAEDVTVVRIFHLSHANPTEMADLLTSLFPDDSRSGGSQTPIAFRGPPGGLGRFLGRFGGPPGMPGGGSTGSGSQSQRIKKRARVLAVPDQRTSSVVVTAARDLMDQISQVVDELDANPANLKSVAVFKLENAEPEEALQVLQDIFQKSGVQNNRNTRNQNSALQTRSTQQRQQYGNTRNTSGRAGQTGRGMNFGQ